jgi:hypothetical protein
MTPPTNSNCLLAQLKLEQLGFVQAIGWQQTIDGGQIARWRKDDILVTMLLEGRRLTIAVTDRTSFTIPCKVPTGAKRIAEALLGTGVVCQFKPEGVWP